MNKSKATTPYDSEAMNSDAMDGLPDGDRQLVTGSDALDEGGTNDSDLGADVARRHRPQAPLTRRPCPS